MGALRRYSTFVLNETQLDAGIIYTGTRLRSRALVQKLLDRRPIQTGALSTLATWPMASALPTVGCSANLFHHQTTALLGRVHRFC